MKTTKHEKTVLRRRRGRCDRRGAAAVEFAVLAPLMFLLIMGAIDVGQIVNVAQTVSDASREGARLAAQNEMTSAADVQSAVLDYLNENYNMSDSALSAAVNVTVMDGFGNVVTDLTTIAEGASLTMRVDMQFDNVRWADSVALGSNKTVSTTTMTRRE